MRFLEEPHGQGKFQLGRPAAARFTTGRRRAPGAQRRPDLRPKSPAAAHPRCLPQREHRPGHLPRDGRHGPARPDPAAAIRRRRPQLCVLRPDRPRDRARRFGLPDAAQRAVLAGHAAHLRFRFRGTEAEIPAQARQGRVDRLLRADRAGFRLRPRQPGHPRPQRARRLEVVRQQELDFQRPAGRRLHRLGQGRRPRDSWLHPRQGHGRPVGPGHPRQGRPARRDHRRDRHGRGLRAH